MAYFTKYLEYLSTSYTTTQDRVANGIALPYKYAGREYDINNYASDGNKISYRSYSNDVGEIRQKNDSVTNGFTFLYNKRSTIYGYPMLSITDKGFTDSALSINVPSTTISGKYRFGDSLYWGGFWKQLYDSTISVNVSINEEYKRAVIFCTNTNWTRERANTYTEPSTIFIQTYNEYGEGNSRPPDLYGGYTNNGVDLTENFINMVWDFGSIPQEVPDAFKNWVEFNAEVIYPYTYTVKSFNGTETLSTRVESPAVNSATLNSYGNQKVLTLTGVNGADYNLTWESVPPTAEKQFLGLAYDVNEKRASIPVGVPTSVTWDSSVTLYEVYAKYRPPVTTFDINLYQNSAEVNRVDKSEYLIGMGILSGVLREECSIITPSITFKQTTVPLFNYVYISAFGRYYYVTGITSVSKDIWRMSLSCDVLMTWKDDIRALTAIIARQENSFNPLLLDSELPAQANQNITVIEFPAGGFTTTEIIERPFLLTVVGA